MNAIEHGNGGDPSRTVTVAVLASPRSIVVRIDDEGAGPDLPVAEQPDLDAKLAGDQPPRGWGLFLIEKMVDELRSCQVDGRHRVELEMSLEGVE